MVHAIILRFGLETPHLLASKTQNALIFIFKPGPNDHSIQNGKKILSCLLKIVFPLMVEAEFGVKDHNVLVSGPRTLGVYRLA